MNPNRSSGVVTAAKCGEPRRRLCLLLMLTLFSLDSTARAQSASPEDTAALTEELQRVNQALSELRKSVDLDRTEVQRAVVDIEVCTKAVEWILRHEEFYRPEYAQHSRSVLKLARERIQRLQSGDVATPTQPGSTALAYRSRVDQSVQPYAVTLPRTFTPDRSVRWPLHVKLHGRNGRLTEVSFIQSFEGRQVDEQQDWIQLDVFGRTNNAYRWSGETDVFEALADVQRRFAIDHRRITMHGFSMGGAGAWHLGLHHPSKWCSVGPGAGFVDFYNYQGVTERLPDYQHQTLGIYDAVDYALNAANVPVCTYGGELDKQLVASTSMVAAAKELDVSIKLLVGPGMGHKFHPDSFREFMAFHREASQRGRPTYAGRRKIRFTTRTLKYNNCDWLTIEEIGQQYAPATVEAEINRDGDVVITTENVDVLQLAREVGTFVILDGDLLPLNSAGDGLLPGVYYRRNRSEWIVMDYDDSRRFQKNVDVRKRHNLQGPIDDAFMEPFICVRGTGQPWSASLQGYANWTLSRFEREYDKWLRARVPVVDDDQLSEDHISSRNLILFGDPGSNQVLAKIVEQLPVKWSRDSIEVAGRTYKTADHCVSLIFPNPLNTSRYVVINSGHTFHERDFKASNSWLFPRLGDIAVIRFQQDGEAFVEDTAWAELFNSAWRLPGEPLQPSSGVER